MRKELKFKINPLQSQQIKLLCNRMINTDPNGENGEYTVSSLYFDTVLNRDYNDTLLNKQIRHKIRLRTYGNTGFYRLEQKYKHGNESSKRTVVLDGEEAVRLVNGDYELLLDKGKDGRYLYSILKTDLYIPKLVVTYDRSAYYLNIDNFRLTVDENIRYDAPETFFAVDKASKVFMNKSVMEIKYDTQVPAWMLSAFKRYGVKLSTNSKYCEGMRAFYGLGQ